MNISSRKITDLIQNPYVWAVMCGAMSGLVLSVYISSRVKLALAGGILRNFESRIVTHTIRSPDGKRIGDTRHLAELSLWGVWKVGNKISPGSLKSVKGAMPAYSGGPLKLKGIVRYPDGTFEGIFRSLNEKKTIILKRGENIGTLKVLDIQPDRVILLRNGKKEAYILFSGKKGKHLPRWREGNQSKASYNRGTASSRVVLSKREVKEALGDMASFLRQVRIVSYMEGGKPRGFQLMDIVPGSIVDRVGLKNGDVVERVNGKTIHTPKDAMQFFSMLQSGRGVTLEIKRRNHHKSISIDLK